VLPNVDRGTTSGDGASVVAASSRCGLADALGAAEAVVPARLEQPAATSITTRTASSALREKRR
jgi:hypothetical protein